eukprot:11510803-Alexandrium_andersonii.AAC.1
MPMPDNAEEPPVRAGQLAALHSPAARGLEVASFQAREGPHDARPCSRAERTYRGGKPAELGRERKTSDSPQLVLRRQCLARLFVDD